MSIPEQLVDRLYEEIVPPERVEFFGPRTRLAKRRLTLSALLLTTSIGAIIFHNLTVAFIAAGLLISYVILVLSNDRPSKTIFALTTTGLLKISTDQVSVYATRKDVESVNGHNIRFNNGLPPLSLLVDPRSRRGAMLVSESLSWGTPGESTEHS